MALYAQARQLAQHGRIRTRRARVAVSGSPHRRQANPRLRSQRMAGSPQQAPRQGQLAIQNRRRPRQAEETVPSVRVTRATSLAGGDDDRGAVASFARDLFDEPFEAEDVILARTEEIPGGSVRRLPVEAYSKLGEAIDSGDPSLLHAFEECEADSSRGPSTASI